jgi:hypothetical protein
VRKFWRITYDTSTAEGFSDYTPAPESLVTAVEQGATLPDQITIQLDFSRGYQ